MFVNVNPQSTLLLGQARGAAICAAVLADLPVVEYTALQVKQAVVGHGKAAKEQVADMVRRLLDLPGRPSPDAADALACAIATRTADKDWVRMAGPVTASAAGGSFEIRSGRSRRRAPCDCHPRGTRPRHVPTVARTPSSSTWTG